MEDSSTKEEDEFLFPVQPEQSQVHISPAKSFSSEESPERNFSHLDVLQSKFTLERPIVHEESIGSDLEREDPIHTPIIEEKELEVPFEVNFVAQDDSAQGMFPEIAENPFNLQ